MPKWLLQSGVHLGSENKQLLISKAVVGDNLEAEFITSFSFAVQPGTGKELSGAAHAFTPDITANMYQILHENERYMNYHDKNDYTFSYHQGQEDFYGMVEQFLVMKYGLKFVVIRMVVHSKWLSKSLTLLIQMQCTVPVFSHVLKQKIVHLHIALDRFRSDLTKWHHYTGSK